MNRWDPMIHNRGLKDTQRCNYGERGISEELWCTVCASINSFLSNRVCTHICKPILVLVAIHGVLSV